MAVQVDESSVKYCITLCFFFFFNAVTQVFIAFLFRHNFGLHWDHLYGAQWFMITIPFIFLVSCTGAILGFRNRISEHAHCFSSHKQPSDISLRSEDYF